MMRNTSLSISETENGQILVHCHAGCRQDDLIAELRKRDLWPESQGRGHRLNENRKGRQKSDWRPIVPVPAGAPRPVLNDAKLGTPTSVWEYKDANGRTLGFVRRFDMPDGKTFRPFTYCESNGGEKSWRSVGFPPPRPLYGLDRLADRIDEPVIITEGEKAADAAGKLFPSLVAVSWPNGAKSVAGADWSPMAGRNVYIWPDADAEGAKAAREVARRCLQAGAESVRVFRIPEVAG